MKRTDISALVVIMVIIGSLVFPAWGHADTKKQHILASTFPVFQMVRQVTQGRDGVKVDIMLPSRMGCPHDYALTPRDMQKLAKADILVVNGLGLEEFLGAPVRKANPDITVIDSSQGVNETLEYKDGHGEAHQDHDTAHHDHAKADHDHDADHHDHGESHHDHHTDHHDHAEDHHSGVNPHLFASPRMTARLVMNIAAELSKADPEGAAVYFKNAQAYATKMNQLADDMAALGKRLKNNRIVQPHGIFDYLARDMGLSIVAVMQAHGQEPSASEMMQLVKTIKNKKVGAIFTEPQYPGKTGKVLSRETGIPTAILDPVASGPDNAPLTYYETIMRQNMKTLETTLGVR